MKAFPRDIPDVRGLKTRHIGIENELGVGMHDEGSLPDDVLQAIEKRGLLEGIGYDGGGRELRTCPISVKSLYQVRGYKYVLEYYEVLRPVTHVLDTGGTHLHISILDSDHENFEANVVALASAFHEQFQKIAGRQTHWAKNLAASCGIRTVEGVKDYLEYRRHSTGRRYNRGYWMLGPTSHQTLEFRGPKGSNDAREILAWADFLDTIVKVANRKSIDGVTFEQLVAGKRIAEYASELKGWRELTKKELTQKVDVNKLVKVGLSWS